MPGFLLLRFEEGSIAEAVGGSITQSVPQVGTGLDQTLLGQLLAVGRHCAGVVWMQQPLIGGLVLGGVSHGLPDRTGSGDQTHQADSRRPARSSGNTSSEPRTMAAAAR